MAEKKKPSGTFYRKRKASLEREDQKQAKAISKFFSRSEPFSSSCVNNDPDAELSVESSVELETPLVEQHNLQIRVHLHLLVLVQSLSS